MPTAERMAKNESLFREVNERIKELNEGFDLGDSPDLSDFVCECSVEDCHDYVRLTLVEYERVRARGNRFLTVPGHVCATNEREVDRHERYSIVEKLGRAGELATAADPRHSP